MKDYLALWGGEIPTGPIQVLPTQVTVVGEQISASKSEFAKVRLTVRPSDTFDVFDAVNERDELEKQDVAWPDPVVFGLLDVLTNAKQGIPKVLTNLTPRPRQHYASNDMPILQAHASA
jgi:hypothetical protein